MSTPTMQQIHDYLLTHGWVRGPGDPLGDQIWSYPMDPDYGPMSWPNDDPDVASWGVLEILGNTEGRCEHAVLAEMLGDVDIATLLARITELEYQLKAALGELELLRPRVTGS